MLVLHVDIRRTHLRAIETVLHMDRIGAAASFGSPCAGFAHTHEINPWHRPRLGSTRPPAAQARGSGSKPSPNTPSSADSTRRSVLAAPAAAGLANWLLVAQPGEAIREVETPDGRSVQAWEFDVPLRVVALRGSVPAQVQHRCRRPDQFCR